MGKAALGLIVAGVVGAGILYATVRGYLHSESFRRFLSAKASEAAQVEGEFSPFRWDGLAVDTDVFDASGRGIVKSVRVDGLHTEVGVGGLRRGVWEIRRTHVERLEVALDVRGRGVAVAGAREPGRAVSAARQDQVPGWLPQEIELQGMDVREVVVKAQLEQGLLSVSQMKVRMEPTGMKQAYGIELTHGTIRQPLEWIPELRLQRARLRYQNGQVFLNNATAGAWGDGHVEVSGEWDMGAGRYGLEGAVTGVQCGDIFNDDWAKRCAGEMSSEFTLDNHAGELVARGSLMVRKGSLTALPVLDALAAYADTRRFRILALSEARTDWKWKSGEIFFSKLVLASEGLARLEGNLYIRGSALDGSFRLGLAPGTLAQIPGAETDVFIAGERGLVWAPLRISGTLDHPEEDLTARLKAAAGLRMFEIIPETGEKVIKFTRSMLGEAPSKTVVEGVKIIGEGSKSLQEATSGIIDGFFGSGRSRKAEPELVPQPVPQPR